MNKKQEQIIEIWSEYITLGQLLKMVDYVGSGAQVKEVLAEGGFKFNGEEENRRGKKLRPEDIVEFPDGTVVKIAVKPV
jgi:ribosome-associated protein